MSILGDLFDLFSRRERPPREPTKPLTPSFRRRVLMLVRDTYGGAINDVLAELHTKLSYVHGQWRLTKTGNVDVSPSDDAFNFLMTCQDDDFLDAIEVLFKLQTYRVGAEDDFVEQVNEFFDIDDLPYRLTKSVWEDIEVEQFGSKYPGRRLRHPPQVIRRDSELVHMHAIAPALVLLRQPDLLNANDEFMRGLDDFRRGDYRDSISKCGSAFESVMKVICKRNRYPYSEHDTAGQLIATIVKESRLEGYWEQPLRLIAAVRNKESSAHGAGTQERKPPEHIARYVISATAAAIILLCDEAY